MSNASQQQSGGIGCLTVLGLIFVTLKLTGNIAWSWLWVLAPFWLPLAILIAVFAVVFVVQARR